MRAIGSNSSTDTGSTMNAGDTNGLGDLIGYERTKITGVFSIRRVVQVVDHLLVDPVGCRY